MSGEDTPLQIGPYELLGELGRGGMGVVYRARHRELQREVALKVITAEDPRLALRFEREARAAARLAGHPNIVGVHDVGHAGDRRYLAMELVDGQDFDEIIREGDLSPQSAAAFVETLARAIAHAHQHGVLHRDLKPGNVMLDRDGVVRVTDFGLAQIQAASADVTRLTRSGEIVGTPAYMAPEQACGEGCDARVDVWAMTVMLYQMLSGRLPFDGSGLLAILTAVLQDDPPPLPAAVPDPLRRIVAVGLTKTEELRYQSASALADDLARFLAGEPVEAQPQPRRRHRRSRGALVGGATAVMTLAAAAGVWWWGHNVAQRATQHQGSAAQASAADHAAQRAATRTAAWYRLIADGGPDLELLENFWHGAPTTRAQVDEALANVAHTAGVVRDGYPGSRAWQAWHALAMGFSGDTAGAATRFALARADADGDPFPELLAARWALAQYVVELGPPQIRYAPTGVVFKESGETAAQRSAREQVEAALEGVMPTLADLGLGIGDLLPAYIVAARAFAARDYPRCASDAATVLGDPLLGADAALLCGLAHYSLADFPAAEQALRRPANRGWRLAMRIRAQALSATAIELAIAGRDSMAAFTEAEAAFNLALMGRPTDGGLLSGLASTHFGRGKAAMRLNQPAEIHFQAAIRTLDQALSAEPGRTDALSNRATAWRLLAAVYRAAGRDPSNAYRRSREDYDAALDAGMPPSEVFLQRGTLWLEQSDAPHTARADAARFARLAVGELDQAVALFPNSERTRGTRARAWMQLARFSNPAPAAGRDMLNRALADLEFCLAAKPDDVPLLHRLATTQLHLGRFSRHDPPAAVRWVERSLATFDDVIRRQPAGLGARRNRASAGTTRAELAVELGQDPTPWYELIIAESEAILQAAPRDWRAAYDAGVTAKNLGDTTGRAGGDGRPQFERAGVFLDQALALNPNYARAWAFRGRVRTMLGERDSAIADLTRAVEIPGAEPWMRTWLAQARAANGR